MVLFGRLVGHPVEILWTGRVLWTFSGSRAEIYGHLAGPGGDLPPAAHWAKEVRYCARGARNFPNSAYPARSYMDAKEKKVRLEYARLHDIGSS